jgi:hypothetical protein
LAADALDAARAETDLLLTGSPLRGGERNCLPKSQYLRQLATVEAPAELAREVLGPLAQPIKLTIFDKTPGSNWKVPWHQDLTIAVQQRCDLRGYGPWSVKDGVLHVQPPENVLAQIVAVRLHLDETPPDNGALRVLTGTHRLGRLAHPEIRALRSRIPETVCAVPAGGAMLMSPLLLHALSASQRPTRRRVLHFEYSSARLPGGLAWV